MIRKISASFFVVAKIGFNTAENESSRVPECWGMEWALQGAPAVSNVKAEVYLRPF